MGSSNLKPLTGGAQKGTAPDLETLSKDCCAAGGWDSKTGITAPETLAQPGLDFAWSLI